MWVWQRLYWPNFTYDAGRFSAILTDYRRRSEKLAGDVTRLAPDDQQEALIDLLVSEAIKTSAIEGELLDRVSVRSSIKAHIGLAPKESASRDPRADGIAALMFSVREHFARPLGAALLGTWQTMAIPDLPSHVRERGGYRTGDSPMLIVSGYIGKQRVHYEAPPSARVPEEMARFLGWYSTTNPLDADSRIPGPLRAGIAHLWFESIHAFDDEDMARAQVDFVVEKACFFDRYRDRLNERQHKVVERMFAAGAAGVEGGMTAQKYVGITRCSKATATRELSALLATGVFTRLQGGGRSTRYTLTSMGHSSVGGAKPGDGTDDGLPQG